MKNSIMWGLCLIFLTFVLVILTYPTALDEAVSRERYLTRLRVNEIGLALDCYKRQYGEYPNGDASEMLAVLMNQTNGNQNPRQILFYSPRKEKHFSFFKPIEKEIDTQGRLLDGWNHPLKIGYDKFKRELQIVSAGENGRFEDGGDDIVFQKVLLP